MTISSVCVAGGGMMGLGILRTLAGSGLTLSLMTRDALRVKPGTPEDVRRVGGFDGPPPDLLIESLPEDFSLKQEFFERAEAAWGGRTIIATNTSTLDYQRMADALRHPDRFCGLHFMQPADAWDMVELIAVRQTAPAVLDAVAAALAAAGRRALRIGKPIPGASINRLQAAMAHEAYHMIAIGAVAAEDIDLVIRRMLAPRMCVTGLIEQKDLSGLVTHAAVQASIVPHLSHRETAEPFVQALAQRGETGADAGMGFYDWREADPAAFRTFAARQVKRIQAVVAEAEAERAAIAPKPRDHG